MKSRIIFAMLAGMMGLSVAQAQTPLTAYAGPDGMISVQKLSCAALANTYQEDADALSMWYSGWFNGLGKKNSFNWPRAKEAEHVVITYCKEHQDKTIIQAIAWAIEQEKKGALR
jgi:HdeA/HdeB family